MLETQVSTLAVCWLQRRERKRSPPDPQEADTVRGFWGQLNGGRATVSSPDDATAGFEQDFMSRWVLEATEVGLVDHSKVEAGTVFPFPLRSMLGGSEAQAMMAATAIGIEHQPRLSRPLPAAHLPSSSAAIAPRPARPTAAASARFPSAHSTAAVGAAAALHVSKDINRRIIRSETLGQVLSVLDDFSGSAHFNTVNVSTALHRMARLAQVRRWLARALDCCRGPWRPTRGARWSHHHPSRALQDTSPERLTMGDRVRIASEMVRLNQMIVDQIEHLDPQGLANVLWSNATMKRVLGSEAIRAVASSVEVPAALPLRRPTHGSSHRLSAAAETFKPGGPETPSASGAAGVAGAAAVAAAVTTTAAADSSVDRPEPARPQRPHPKHGAMGEEEEVEEAGPRLAAIQTGSRRESHAAAADATAPQTPMRAEDAAPEEKARVVADIGAQEEQPGALARIHPSGSEPARPQHQQEGDMVAAIEAEAHARRCAASGCYRRPEADGGFSTDVAGDSGRADAALWEVLVREVDRKVSGFAPQGIANTLWAFATLDHKPPAAVVSRVLAAAEGMLEEALPQHLSILTWSCASLGFQMPDHVLDHVSSRAQRCASEFKPQELANLVWGFAKLQHYDAPLLDSVARACRTRLPQFSRSQNVSNIVWAYATLHHHPGPLLAEFAAEAARHLHEYKPQEVANLLWAYATLGEPCPAVVQALEREVCARRRWLGEWKQQEVSNLLWALAVMSAASPGLWHTVLGSLRGHLLHGYTHDELRQLYQAGLLAELQLPGALAAIPAPLCARAREAWQQAAHAGRVLGELQQDVARTVRMLGYQQQDGVLTDDGLVSVDILVPQLRLVVEVDGPRHYLANMARPLGSTIARARLLRSRGYLVANVGYRDWESLGSDPAAKAFYLQQLIEATHETQQVQQQQQMQLRLGAEEAEALAIAADSWLAEALQQQQQPSLPASTGPSPWDSVASSSAFLASSMAGSSQHPQLAWEEAMLGSMPAPSTTRRLRMDLSLLGAAAAAAQPAPAPSAFLSAGPSLSLFEPPKNIWAYDGGAGGLPNFGA